ncbi:hypothetical protein MJO28_014826 [Puccinia striiformis f. sp. tritici]|uniref:Uncharacterized protein n=1 Tax=Puccinia striiformis f. sp. tritici TaxID=168172 RepID=A0ACC0DRF8_9BASI|nr:hypothetical protein MJO28_014826 [Puccinia striiformis f. sp. tritici]
MNLMSGTSWEAREAKEKYYVEFITFPVISSRSISLNNNQEQIIIKDKNQSPHLVAMFPSSAQAGPQTGLWWEEKIRSTLSLRLEKLWPEQAGSSASLEGGWRLVGPTNPLSLDDMTMQA